MDTEQVTKYSMEGHLRAVLTMAQESKKLTDLVAFTLRAAEIAKKIQA